MASTLSPMIAPDIVLSFEINPGTLLQFLESRVESGPRLKCFEGSVTLVSPGMPHEVDLDRLSNLVLAICLELRIEHTPLGSTTWNLPLGLRDTAYEADAAYSIQSHGRAKEDQSRHRDCGEPSGEEGSSGRGVHEDPRIVGYSTSPITGSCSTAWRQGASTRGRIGPPPGAALSPS